MCSSKTKPPPITKCTFTYMHRLNPPVSNSSLEPRTLTLKVIWERVKQKRHKSKCTSKLPLRGWLEGNQDRSQKKKKKKTNPCFHFHHQKMEDSIAMGDERLGLLPTLINWQYHLKEFLKQSAVVEELKKDVQLHSHLMSMNLTLKIYEQKVGRWYVWSVANAKF